jgi:UDPglucose--hexose-1-phosphate uridylyltransferase
MKFETMPRETVMLNPKKDMAVRKLVSEIRKDPLTGRTARICHFMPLKWQKPDFDRLVAGTETVCPFCPDKVHVATPCFPKDIVPEGRLIRGDKVLFPNIAPYDSISAVAILGRRHFIPMAEMEPDRIADTFRLTLDFFRRLHRIGHSESVYHIVSWNYMPASGSSLIHPHLQVLATSTAPNLLREELTVAKTYWDANGKNFWDDLIEEEAKDGRRFLGRIGRTTWLTAFAPMGVAGDVVAIVDSVCSTLELTDADLADLADGLTRLMKGYDRIGIYNFNMCFFPGAEGENHSRFHMVFSPRSFFNQALGTPDVAAPRHLFNETVCMAFPEEINQMLKADF